MTDESSPAPRKAKKPSLTAQRRSARSFALQALYQWQMAGQPINEIEAQFRVDNDMSGTDVKLFSEILKGVATSKGDLDEAYRPFLDRALEDLDPVELAVLRIGSYELINRIEVPYRVAINESVDLAKIFGATDSHRYVNGILDKLAQRVRMTEIRAARGK
ncbi:transcription antitermination factor NusB [Neptunomonas concharum]|jgi:N utilization substance protein B|uniref:Transcription antitermination protein NusB n=1 Tax=Neptunomonas concharum TaxID=1031538 RepID=A0A5P1R8F5_9GAMM|nr:transcription antitermination factor NusB [Neptunomonas concharum]QEQ95555.1 transcription antitermination factor NusB [Neptunomonas concharum]